jgi:catechol 2,3-dioxygenase-like lactoylglutathione lyase family enzyme
LKEKTMLDHMILTVSNVERSLAFYEAALRPLNIRFFLPYKGEGDHPDLWGFGDGKRAFFWIKQGKPDPASIHWGFTAENNGKVDEFYRAAISAGARTIFHHGHGLNTIRDTTPPMYLTRTGIRLRSSIKASRTSHLHQRSMHEVDRD